nr:reverse transcriptase domain-containing protein [Tanacetum cinerariifolium]
MKANDAILKNMQTNMTSLTNSNLELKNMFAQFMKMNTASSSSSRTLQCNTITNPKEDLKGITTRCGTAYQGPTIPTTTSSPLVVEHKTEAVKDMVHPTNNESTKYVQPQVVPTKSQILNSEPVISPIIELVASPNKLSLPDLSPTCMTLELANRSISHPVGVVEDVFVKVGRSFLKTRRALIDVVEGELTLHVGKEAITFNLDQTSRYSANYNDMMANQIDVIDMACEEYSQEVLGFSDMIAKAFFNDDPSLPPPNQGNYLPQVRKELKICEAKTDKSSIHEPPEVEHKDLPPHLEYVFLEGDDKFPVIIVKDLSVEVKTALITVLKSHKRAFLRNSLISKSLGKPRTLCTKKGSFTIVENEENELIPTRLVTRWHVCTDYRKLNESTRKDHFPLPFIDQMIERLVGNQYYCFLDCFSGYFQISINPKDQEKTTFTCLYGTFAYHCMPFGLCNALGTFQRCMMAIFHDMIKKTMEVFMDDFLVFKNSFQTCLSHLERMLKRCEDTNLCLNWEKSQFMVKEGIVLRHKISKNGIEVDKAKVDVIEKLPHPTTVKGIRSFLGHAGFYRRGNKYILVAIDYLSKWVEAKALPINDARVVCKFLKNLFAKFGTPRPIISDRGTYFYNDQFAKVMLKFGVTHRLATPYHPQTSGHVEALKHANFDLKTADDHRKVQLNELCDQAYENSLIYKEKTKRLHDSKIKDRVFNIDDRVLLFNSRLKIFSGKLKSRWSGPFTISHVFPYGTIKLSQLDGRYFKVNGHRLKNYFGEDIPKMVVPNLQTFLKDQ